MEWSELFIRRYESMDDGRRHPINLRNEDQEESHHFKNESMDDGHRHPIN